MELIEEGALLEAADGAHKYARVYTRRRSRRVTVTHTLVKCCALNYSSFVDDDHDTQAQCERFLARSLA